jgi:V/A-type H+-transporting ATPase subunit D
MAEQKIEGVNPTRMELLEIRKKIKLAEKGHKLLEDKRDALIERFFDAIEKRDKLSQELDEKFKTAFLSLIEAQMIMGEDRVEEVSYLIENIGEVTFEHENIMGVIIPKMNRDKISISMDYSYSFTGTCSKLDDAKKLFNELISYLLDRADIEAGIKSLAVEIEKTKRRVNVLENNLIPKLYATRKYIEMQLEEREREDFFRRKRIKALMESKKG